MTDQTRESVGTAESVEELFIDETLDRLPDRDSGLVFHFSFLQLSKIRPLVSRSWTPSEQTLCQEN